MDLRQCENCGEKIDAGKAFCPGCGQPLIAEELRSDVSEFDASGKTVQFGQTVYNKMLSEMGLNISDAPNRPPASAVTVQSDRTMPEAKVADKSRYSALTSNTLLWVVGIVALFFFLLAAAAVLLFLYFYLTGRVSLPV